MANPDILRTLGALLSRALKSRCWRAYNAVLCDAGLSNYLLARCDEKAQHVTPVVGSGK